MIELENSLLRVYFDEEKGIVEAVEVLEKQTKQSKISLKQETLVTPVKEVDLTQEVTDFNLMTVKDLKAYAEEKKIELNSSLRKAEIIEILEKSEEKKSRRKLPDIPKSN